MNTETALTIFNFQEKEVRTKTINGEIWFVAKDVCEILGLDQVSRAMDRLDTDEVGSLKVTHPQSPGKTIEVNAVNEPGLYQLIIASNKPEAKPFKRWVTHDLIPAVRKNGYYIAPNATRQVKEKFSAELREVNSIFKASKALAKALGLDTNQQILTANRLTKEATGFDAIEKFQVCLAAPVNAARLMTPTEIGKTFNPPLSAQAINSFLAGMNFQSKVGDGKEGWKWVGNPDQQAHWYLKMQDGNGTRFNLNWYDTVIPLIQEHMASEVTS